MEKLYYNLSEAELSKGGKILVWILAVFFFVVFLWDILANLVFGMGTFQMYLAVVPFIISLFMTLFASFATVKRDHFFSIDDDKIEFKNGIFKALKHSFLWENVAEIHLPNHQKHAALVFKDGTSFNINLMWIEKKKASGIRKHLYHLGKQKNIKCLKF